MITTDIRPGETLVKGIIIAGHTYNVLVTANHMAKDRWIVVATECVGRWPMSRMETGDKWLDSRLSLEANEKMFYGQ
jgi:hypothetical protein